METTVIGGTGRTVATFPTRDQAEEYAALHPAFIAVQADSKTGRIEWSNDWPRVSQLAAAGQLREKCYGPSTYNHVEVFLA